MSRRLDTTRTAPDILDCIANLSSDEVFTPPRLANQMLDLLPKDVWKNPDLKWLDPGCKTGVFLREIAKRLMDQLSEAIPDENIRREHIYKNMLYGLPITELTSMLSRRSVYYSKNADSERYAVVRMGSSEGNIPLVPTSHSFKSGSCTECGAPESLERGEARENYAYPFIHPDQFPGEFKDMKFDVIVGNPPYQINTDGFGAQAAPVYQKFVKTAIDMQPEHVVMIIPSRWFSGGNGLDEFRAQMIADRSLKTIVDHPKLFECFPGVEIKGGVNYFHWERGHDGDCKFATVVDGIKTSEATRDLRAFGDVLVRSNEATSVLEKVRAVGEPTFDSGVSGINPFNLATNFSGDEAPGPHTVTLHRRGGISAVSRGAISKGESLIDKFKVLTPKAGDGHGRIPAKVMGEPIVADPESCCTMTYIVAGAFGSETEAKNCAAYMQSKFFRFLVSLRKPAQNVSRSVFAFVPLLDMSVTWTDEVLFARYNLSEDEILFIKSQIKEMP